MSSARGVTGSESSDPFQILARGPWEPSRVVSRRVSRSVRRDAAATDALAAAWSAAEERARRSGQRLYPGQIYGLAAWRVTSAATSPTSDEGDPGTLELDFHETDYGEFVGTNCSPTYLKRPREQATRADALGISVLLISGDEILFHRRGAGVYEWPRAIDTPGGHMEPGAHDERGEPSPFLAARDELESELGLGALEVRGLQALGLTRIADTEKPQLVFAARIELGPEELRERAARARESFETSAIWPVKIADLERIDREARDARPGSDSPLFLTPAGRAAIRLARDGLGFLPP